MSEAIHGFQGKYRWLSNFISGPVVYEGVEYPTVEHAYQAAKTTVPANREVIRGCAKPGDAKRAARRLKPLRPDWDAIKVDVMQGLLEQKFAAPEFAGKLRATGDTEIVEVNTWRDTFWGQCPLGNGQNNLGKLLMDLRSRL